MTKAWWKSLTVWVAVGSVAVCFIPQVRSFIHQADVAVVSAQALVHLLLRIKTKVGIGRNWVAKEAG
jgi:hypothetical protein